MVVLEYKACSLPYFLDEMEIYELEILLDNIEYSQKQEWERTRFESFIQAQTQSTKKLLPTDIIKFNWDKNTSNSEEKNVNVTEQDKKRLIEKMNKIIEEKNN